MKKIMFNDRYGLTKAVLEGRKAQTRRVFNAFDGELEPCYFNGTLRSVYLKDNRAIVYLPAYKVGDEVAVAQSYFDCGYSTRPRSIANPIQYSDGSAGFYNKMFVRADLMPHRIKITNIRVERLQDISDEDCLKEGIIHHHARGDRDKEDYGFDDDFWFTTPRKAFATLIDKTCGRGTWSRNPWVFVYDFELVK